jgi:hypothetical protein
MGAAIVFTFPQEELIVACWRCDRHTGGSESISVPAGGRSRSGSEISGNFLAKLAQRGGKVAHDQERSGKAGVAGDAHSFEPQRRRRDLILRRRYRPRLGNVDLIDTLRWG